MASSQPSRSEFSRRTTENTHDQLNDSEKPAELRGFLKFAVEKQVQQLISKPLAFSYLTANFNFSKCSDEFRRFLYYIEEHELPDRKQLTPIIFPVFVHLYLLMLQNSATDENGYEDACLFFRMFKSLFLNANGYEDVLEQLNELKNPSDVQKHDYFSMFWDMKYIIKASVDVVQSLKTFLEKEKCKALVYILHFFLYFEDEDSYDFVDEESSKSESAENDSHTILTNVDPEEIMKSEVLPVDVEYNLPYYSSADFNENETEICIASHNSSLGFAAATSACIYFETLANSSRNVKKIKLPKVTSVKYLPGDSNSVVASYGIDVKLINKVTGKDVFKYNTAHAAKIWNVDVNETFFATASKDLKTCIWKFNDPVAVKEYVAHKSDVTTVKFHPNGLYFATGSTDATVYLWDVDKTIPIRYFTGHCGKITSITFSPDGKSMATTDSMGAVKLWDIRTSLLAFEVPDVKAPCSNVCFNDVNTQFAFCDDAGNFRKWDYRFVNEIETIEYNKCPLVMKFNKGRQWKIALKVSRL